MVVSSRRHLVAPNSAQTAKEIATFNSTAELSNAHKHLLVLSITSAKDTVLVSICCTIIRVTLHTGDTETSSSKIQSEIGNFRENKNGHPSYREIAPQSAGGRKFTCNQIQQTVTIT